MIRRHEPPAKVPRKKRVVKLDPEPVKRAPKPKPAPQPAPRTVGERRVDPRAGTEAIQRGLRAWLRRRWAPVAAAAFLALVVGGLVAAWETPLLRVRGVEVVGTTAYEQEVIVALVDFWDEHLLTVDFETTAAAITELPLVASVEMERRWPGAVRITVHEREPWGSWEQAGLRYTIDREGYVLGRQTPPAGSTTILSDEGFSLRAGERVDADAVHAAALIANQIEDALGTRAVEMTFSPDEGIRVRTADGQTALLGDSSGITYKLAVWKRVASEATARHITYSTIDLRFGDRPVLR